jgi:SAM-dependent methyltransferase
MDYRQQLRDKVREAYSSAAERPEEKHPFPVGRAFAESIGYPAEVLDILPAVSVASFTGVSNVSIFADIPRGSAVLDLGCGAGLDTFVAAERTGPEGRVIAVDFSEAMIGRARQGAQECGCSYVTFHVADAEEIPLPDDSVDIALVNGIFNLSPFRDRVFSELVRVLRKDGSVYGAELILRESLPAETTCSLENWFR